MSRSAPPTPRSQYDKHGPSTPGLCAPDAGPQVERRGSGERPGIRPRLDLSDTPSQTHDALAELFLGEGPLGPDVAEEERSEVPVRGVERSASVLIEQIAIGHLPVFAAGWVSQYARETAARLGMPVALVRIEERSATVDVFGVEAEPCDTLEEALAEAARAGARAWLVRDDEPLPGSLGIGVAVLTGADEAAVVQSYQIIKGIDREGGSDCPIRLVVMGAPAERAEDAASRMHQAAGAFLGRTLDLADPIQRIGGSPPTTLYRGPNTLSTPELVAVLRAAHMDAQATARPEQPRAEERAVSHGSRAESVAGARTRARRRLERLASEEPSSLAEHMPDLHPIEARCPYAPLVELATDEHGCLHLLAGGLDADGLAILPGEALEALMTASAWAVSHDRLLGLSSSERMISPREVAPVLHVMTDEPVRARGLLDTDIRVHLLSEIEIAGRKGWFCKALN
jgi:hypothetical protein